MDLKIGGLPADALEDRLDHVALTSGSALCDVLAPVLRRPGKRMRPRLLLTVAGDQPGAAALTCAAGIEFLHQSSLIHDDLMDQAPLRGDVPTVHSAHGAGMAVVAGDFLVAAGIEALASVDARHAAIGLRAYADMCRGQALETTSRHQILDVEKHLGILADKTGALIGAACMIGAQLADLDSARTTQVGRFGLALGVLYQLVDDLFDLCATAAEAGKPVGQDLANGIYTLPILLAARRHGDAFTRHLDRGPAGLDAARDLATRPEILDEVTKYAQRYAAIAERNSPALPPGAVASQLTVLPGRLVGRVTAGGTMRWSSSSPPADPDAVAT